MTLVPITVTVDTGLRYENRVIYFAPDEAVTYAILVKELSDREGEHLTAIGKLRRFLDPFIKEEP